MAIPSRAVRRGGGHGLSLCAAVVLGGVVSGCAHVGDTLSAAEASGLRPTLFDGGGFRLNGWQRSGVGPDETLTVYIEGDGMAWLSRSRPSSDPTPRHPVALELATADPNPGVLVLARPCQFDGRMDPRCATPYWTNARFAPEIITSIELAIEQAKTRAGARHLILVGYSGGGVVAALIAARHPETTGLVTLAAPLDVDGWTDYHEISRLTGSLRPQDEGDGLKTIRQHHFLGSRDEVVPLAVTARYGTILAGACMKTTVIEGFDHSCCWPRLDWRRALASMQCSPPGGG